MSTNSLTNENIKIEVKYKEPILFNLRMISITEENELRQKMFGLTDNEKAEKQYELNVALLVDYSINVEDTNKIREYFSKWSVMKERIAEYAVRAYFLKLQPEVNFL